jgi:hypothetical protein
VQSRLLGRFNVDNLLAVAGALHALDEWSPCRDRKYRCRGCSPSMGA